MILYHGTNLEIKEIDLNKCKPFKDFGKGFYLTPIRAHAENLANARVYRFGGKATINKFVFNQSEAEKDPLISFKVFDKPNIEWVNFVIMNRLTESTVPCHNFDIVIGPIADDRVAASIDLYQDEYITMEELIERLKYREFNVQYFFHTQQALKYLKKI